MGYYYFSAKNFVFKSLIKTIINKEILYDCHMMNLFIVRLNFAAYRDLVFDLELFFKLINTKLTTKQEKFDQRLLCPVIIFNYYIQRLNFCKRVRGGNVKEIWFYS